MRKASPTKSVKSPLITGNVYHLFNRGVAKQDIFKTPDDCRHFLTTLSFYLEASPTAQLSKTDPEIIKDMLETPAENPLTSILAYCLMSNHFHLIAKQLVDDGIVSFIRRALDSYTRYFNTKYDRVGTIFQGRYKNVIIENSEQLMHLSRYIHLNPFIGRIVQKPEQYIWSSYQLYLKNKTNRLCDPSMVLELFDSSPQKYQELVDDYSEYARSLADLKSELLLE